MENLAPKLERLKRGRLSQRKLLLHGDDYCQGDQIFRSLLASCYEANCPCGLDNAPLGTLVPGQLNMAITAASCLSHGDDCEILITIEFSSNGSKANYLKRSKGHLEPKAQNSLNEIKQNAMCFIRDIFTTLPSSMLRN